MHKYFNGKKIQKPGTKPVLKPKLRPFEVSSFYLPRNTVVWANSQREAVDKACEEYDTPIGSLYGVRPI